MPVHAKHMRADNEGDNTSAKVNHFKMCEGFVHGHSKKQGKVRSNNGGPLQQTAGAGGQGGKGRCTWT